MMAYIQIPKINVKLPVYHGTSDPILAKGTGHVATTHLPTDNKTVHSVITGHTGLVGHIFFDNLTQMKKGDTFEVRVLTHHLTYKVDSITVIWPTQVKALQPVSNHNYVTLLTCTPYGINDHRLLVRGKFVGESKPLTQPTGLPLWYLWLFLLMVLLCVIAEIACRKRRNRNKRLLKEAMSGGPSGEALALLGSSSSVASKSRRLGKNSQIGRLNEKKIRRHMRWQLLGMWVFSILAIFFAWASFGMMMRTGFLPAFDLGYSWWDQHVTYWFSITGMKHLSMPINF